MTRELYYMERQIYGPIFLEQNQSENVFYNSVGSSSLASYFFFFGSMLSIFRFCLTREVVDS